MRFFIITFLFYSITAAAQPSESYMLNPVTDGYQSRYANSLIYFDNENVRIVMNFNNLEGNYYEFFAVVENKLDSAFVFEPLDIYAEMYADEDSLTAEPDIVYSADPDVQLEYINKEIEDLADDHSLHSGLSCLFSGVMLALSVAANEPPEPPLSTESEDDEFAYNMSILEDEKAFWENEVMRGTVIQPGKKTAGSFFIPASPGAEWVKVIIPVGDSEYIFNFRQSKIWIIDNQSF